MYSLVLLTTLLLAAIDDPIALFLLHVQLYFLAKMLNFPRDVVVLRLRIELNKCCLAKMRQNALFVALELLVVAQLLRNLEQRFDLLVHGEMLLLQLGLIAYLTRLLLSILLLLLSAHE